MKPLSALVVLIWLILLIDVAPAVLSRTVLRRIYEKIQHFVRHSEAKLVGEADLVDVSDHPIYVWRIVVAEVDYVRSVLESAVQIALRTLHTTSSSSINSTRWRQALPVRRFHRSVMCIFYTGDHEVVDSEFLVLTSGFATCSYLHEFPRYYIAASPGAGHGSG